MWPLFPGSGASTYFPAGVEKKEWHGPDRMILNATHILFIEPVSPDSQVAKLIEDAQKK